MAFLVNLLAFPFFLGLLPYVAKDVFAVGPGRPRLSRRRVLVGRARSARWSSALAAFALRAARAMLWSGALWFVAILVFGQTTS